MAMPITGKLYSPFVIETDVKGDIDFFKPYMNQMEWTDSNILYGSKIPEITGNKPMVKHFVQHISEYDRKLTKYVVTLFRELGIKTKDFRADFFLVKEGGYMPPHIDGMSKIALLLPLSLNTGPLVCETENTRFEILYQNLTILNTQVCHSVESPTEDRLLFRIGVHDVLFEDIGIYKDLAKY
jgi:hypothetical protein